MTSYHVWFSVNISKPGCSENHTRKWSSKPADYFQFTINREVALLLRQLWLVDWLIDYVCNAGDANAAAAAAM